MDAFPECPACRVIGHYQDDGTALCDNLACGVLVFENPKETTHWHSIKASTVEAGVKP